MRSHIGRNNSQSGFEEFSKLVDDLEGADVPNPSASNGSTALALPLGREVGRYVKRQESGTADDFSFDNLRQSVIEHSHLLSAADSELYNALIINTNIGSYKYRVALLKELSPDEKRRFSRLMKVYGTSPIKFVVIDAMNFDMLAREAYAARNLVKVSSRKNQQQTRTNRVWGGKQAGINELNPRPAAKPESKIEDLAGERLDISNLDGYYEIQKKMEQEDFDENEIDTFSWVKFLLQDFIQSGGSDLHLHAARQGGRARYRFQGTPYTRFSNIPIQRFREICNSLCTLGAKDPSKMKRDTVDSVIKLTINLEGEIKDVEFRFASLPSLYCPSVNLRGQTKPLRDITKVGFLEPQLAQIYEVVENDRGIVIVTGPTGSGKTNTLNCVFSILEKWDQDDDDMVILELGNPIEIESERRVQIPIVESASEKLTDIIYQKLFKATMRFDPDVIAFTEIRSGDEARIAFRAASTGHLVFTTMHAADVEETFSRLFEMGIDRSFIAKGVLGIVAQTLVQKLCVECRIEDREASAMSGGGNVYRADESGCPNCAESKQPGFLGQTVIAEVLTFNKDIKQMIVEGCQPSEIVSKCIEKKYLLPMKQIALEKLSLGVTAESEIKKLVGLRTEINSDAENIPEFDDDIFTLPVKDAEYEDLKM